MSRPGRRTRNAAAFERTVAALRSGGRLEPVDAALVAAGRNLAALLDDHDEPVVPVTWAYLNVLRELRGVVGASSDDDLGQLIAALSAPLGDAPE
jgi:hypothetical protein